jgi:hypothetical protein
MVPRILDLSTRWRRVVGFTLWSLSPYTLWMGGWVGHTAGLEAVVVKRKIHAPAGIQLRSSSPHTIILLTQLRSVIIRFLIVKFFCKHNIYYYYYWSRGSSVSMVTRVQRGRPGIGFRFLAKADISLLHSVQTEPGIHPASSPMCIN